MHGMTAAPLALEDTLSRSRWEGGGHSPNGSGFGPIGAGYRIRTKGRVEMALLATEGDRVCTPDTMSFPSPSHHRWDSNGGGAAHGWRHAGSRSHPRSG
jgi:hypothetical protein